MSYVVKIIESGYLHKVGYSTGNIEEAQRFKTIEDAQARMVKYCEPYWMKDLKYEIKNITPDKAADMRSSSFLGDRNDSQHQPTSKRKSGAL